jgi:hypothetical protein
LGLFPLTLQHLVAERELRRKRAGNHYLEMRMELG